MLEALRRWGRRLRFGSLERGDFSGGSRRPVENIDALAARGDHPNALEGGDAESGSAVPPGYVKSYDEARPRK